METTQGLGVHQPDHTMAAGGRPGPPIKFVGHDVIGLPVKRKQVVQACLPCRKRKVFPSKFPLLSP